MSTCDFCVDVVLLASVPLVPLIETSKYVVVVLVEGVDTVMTVVF